MAVDQSQLEAAVSAVREPEIGLSLGDLGLVRSVRPRRRRVQVEVALPVAAWPGTEELAEGIHRAAASVAGVEEIELEFVVMTDEERAGLRQRLRAGMAGGVEPGAGGRRPRARPRGSRACAGRADAGVPRTGVQDACHWRVVGQGWRRQVDGDGQPRHRAGAGRPPGRLARCRRLRLLGPQDARDRSRSDHHRRHGDPDLCPRRQVPLHGLLRAGRPAGDLARPDAAQGDPAVPHRCVLGGAGLRAHRHAARHRRRRAHPGRGDAAGRDHRRDHAAGRGAAGGPALGVRRPAAQALRARRHREHELVHRRRREALRALRRGRGCDPRRRPRDPPARAGPARERRAPGRRRGPSGHRRRSRQRDGDRAFRDIAEKLAALGPARVYRRELSLR